VHLIMRSHNFQSFCSKVLFLFKTIIAAVVVVVVVVSLLL